MQPRQGRAFNTDLLVRTQGHTSVTTARPEQNPPNRKKEKRRCSHAGDNEEPTVPVKTPLWSSNMWFFSHEHPPHGARALHHANIQDQHLLAGCAKRRNVVGGGKKKLCKVCDPSRKKASSDGKVPVPCAYPQQARRGRCASH